MYRNSNTDYGTIAKWLHWLTALCFLLAYVSVKYRHWFTEKDTPENWTALQLHLSVGITVAVIVLLRIIWKLYDTSPGPEPGTKMEHLAAKMGHYVLYAVMIIMPVTGYIGTGVDTEFFFLFDITRFADTSLYPIVSGGMDFKTFEEPIDFIHKEVMGEWLVWMLILGHAGAALYHHFHKKDRTLKRMTNGAE